MTAKGPRTIRHPQLAPEIPPPPVPPVQPGLEDCCRSGCTPCVFDLYEEAMERYRVQLAKWKARYPAG
ncbi:MAG: oxidoreductase-like domain-containing protein [Massilia sp.]